MRQVGREQYPVLDDEDVLTGTLADRAVGRKSDALGKTQALGLLTDELAGKIVTAGFGECRQGIGSHPLPRGHAHVHPGLFAFMAEVLAPFPGGDRDIHRWIDFRSHANFAVAAKGHRADIGAVRELVAVSYTHLRAHET